MNILLTLVIGLIAGWLTGLIFKGEGYGIVADIALGVVGALVGTWILGALGIGTYGFLGTIVAAVLGAVILVLIVRTIRQAYVSTRLRHHH